MLEMAQGPYPLKLLTSFFDSLDASLHTIQPIGRQIELDEDQVLARYCFVLALLEDVGRTGRYMDNLLMVPAPRQNLDELLAISEDAWINDLCAMSTLFYDNYHHLLSQPCIPNPTFVGSGDVGGADADIIVDGCLIEIKSSIQPKIVAKWLYQLAGYVLLDYDDQYSIHSVGIYMARQGKLLQWPISDFLRLLTGNDTVSEDWLCLTLREALEGDRIEKMFPSSFLPFAKVDLCCPYPPFCFLRALICCLRRSPVKARPSS